MEYFHFRSIFRTMAFYLVLMKIKICFIIFKHNWIRQIEVKVVDLVHVIVFWLNPLLIDHRTRTQELRFISAIANDTRYHYLTKRNWKLEYSFIQCLCVCVCVVQDNV